LNPQWNALQSHTFSFSVVSPSHSCFFSPPRPSTSGRSDPKKLPLLSRRQFVADRDRSRAAAAGFCSRCPQIFPPEWSFFPIVVPISGVGLPARFLPGPLDGWQTSSGLPTQAQVVSFKMFRSSFPPLLSAVFLFFTPSKSPIPFSASGPVMLFRSDIPMLRDFSAFILFLIPFPFVMVSSLRPPSKFLFPLAWDLLLFWRPPAEEIAPPFYLEITFLHGMRAFNPSRRPS